MVHESHIIESLVTLYKFYGIESFDMCVYSKDHCYLSFIYPFAIVFMYPYNIGYELYK